MIKILIRCKMCNKEFYVKYFRIKSAKYCSRKCYAIDKKRLKSIQDKKRMKTDYIKFNQYLKTIPVGLLGWLAGFWEGEGHIGQHKNINFNYTFTISQKDLTSLYRIKNLLKVGNVARVRYKNIKIGRYNLYSSGKILALVELFLKIIKGNHRQKQLKKVYKFLRKIKCF